MQTRPFEACVFDLYDTLVFFTQADYVEEVTKIAALCGIGRETYLREWRALTTDSNVGRLPTTADRVRRFLKVVGVEVSEELVELFVKIEHDFLRDKVCWYDDAVTTLRELRRMGIKIGLVTNASSSVWEVVRSKQLDALVDQLVISCEVGVAKPDLGIYFECLRRLGSRPAVTAFVGDGNDRELEGAKKAGLLTVLVKRDTFRAFVFEQSSADSADVVVSSLAAIPTILRSHVSRSSNTE